MLIRVAVHWVSIIYLIALSPSPCPVHINLASHKIPSIANPVRGTSSSLADAPPLVTSVVLSTDAVSVGAYPSRYPNTAYGVSKSDIPSPLSPEHVVVAV